MKIGGGEVEGWKDNRSHGGCERGVSAKIGRRAGNLFYLIRLVR